MNHLPISELTGFLICEVRYQSHITRKTSLLEPKARVGTHYHHWVELGMLNYFYPRGWEGFEIGSC